MLYSSFQHCTGTNQSPIDISYKGESSPEPHPLEMRNYDKVRNIRFTNRPESSSVRNDDDGGHGTWKNNGHTAVRKSAHLTLRIRNTLLC